MLKELIIALFVFISLASLSTHCTSFVASRTDSVYMDYNYKELGYVLNEPIKKHFLNYDLEEISGLTFYKENQVAAIEDEKGKLYFIDVNTGDITRTIEFGSDGDYEGVEFIGDQVYILRSDGDIYNFTLTNDNKADANKEETVLDSKNDAEGLGFDGQNLIVALKGSGDTKDNNAHGKAIYSYDVEKKEITEKELFDFHKDDLTDFIKHRKYFSRVSDFDPSAIAVHPFTKDYYVLSADKVLAIFNQNFSIKEVIKLNPITYNQAEGICFGPDGTMYISSEGDGAKGKLMVIEYNPDK